MTACTSFLAFFAEQMLAFAGKMHSRPGRCPSKARRAEVASTRSEAQCAATEHRASVSAGRCEDAGRPLRIEGAIAADEPSEAGRAASELANDAERPC